ncbi:hypothetical protein CONPUDRAFT_66882 [Coniophora puteana RWD-64-598 SS2]|uniref:Uncharacterized protein n=1 Tax=Coniophora puteana (strain RWD-64-598) TaxID=741705 RepID=A0A5M3M7Y9_CONPW|nr:uncharacterized protein CONPUDRAFT_66882 [Coniophora puteana RWD-64-598 SS2]EIW75036.1 hypothetical protein CONPUDRAFT_66882 [Coniophora puteana RWD-64-598 SS2]
MLFTSRALAGGVNFTSCLANVQNFYNDTSNQKYANYSQLNNSLLDNNGFPVAFADIFTSTAITYTVCTNWCGSGDESFEWTNFSQQFSAWLLPYLALLSQLPFGARYRSDNLMSAVLTAGSPTLAGYTLFCTMLNTRWISQSFESVRKFPNTAQAARVLSNLQQVPLRVNPHSAMLSSLVVLPENDQWWSEFSESLNYKNTWSISAAVSIAWVIVAYALTVADSLANVNDNIDSVGQSIGTAFLWLIPVVIGWQQLSPKCDFDRLSRAFDHSEAKAYIATHHGSVKVGELTEERAISIGPEAMEDVMSPDEDATPPIFNYSRVFGWSRSAEEVLRAFQYASKRAFVHKPVDPEREWEVGDGESIHPGNRHGAPYDVEMYCGRMRFEPSSWGSGVWGRIVFASVAGLMLQWGTTGGAVMMVWFTPTTKLGCRSFSYLIYGALSTIIWMLMLASSIAAHHASSFHWNEHKRYRDAAFHTWKTVADVLRWSGKALAVLNSLILCAIPILQFSNVFNNCYCNSSVMGRGPDRAYNVINLTDTSETQILWIVALVVASLCSIAFVAIFNLLTDTLAFNRDS